MLIKLVIEEASPEDVCAQLALCAAGGLTTWMMFLSACESVVRIKKNTVTDDSQL